MTTCLVTGGSGSLGQALTRYLLYHTDWRIIVYSRDELKQANMAAELKSDRVDFRIGDVRDLARLETAFRGVDYVVHAAALKRIDSVCYDPDEVVKTNVDGSRNVLHAARSCGVSKVLLISSDKACYPTNAYGVSKAMAEWLFVMGNTYGYPCGTISSVLRYGNVLNSRGSVLHLWREQLAKDQPLTITHPDMTRFVLTLDQACELVYGALYDMEGGEIFVPKLPAVKIYDMARCLADAETIVTTETGLRPGGEKLHETLMTYEEGSHAKDINRAYLIVPTVHPWTDDPAWKDEAPSSMLAFVSDITKKLSDNEIRDLL